MRYSCKRGWARCALVLAIGSALASVACHYDQFNIPPTLPPYTIRELGLLPGGTQSQANAGSASTIVGWAIVSGATRHAVTFSGGQAHALLEPPGATASEARGVNDAGMIVGFATVGGVRTAIVWSSAGAAPVQLPSLGGAYSFARSINNAGVVVGNAQTSAGDTVLVLWEGSGGGYSATRIRVRTVTYVGTDSVVDTVPVGHGYAPSGINELGQVVGNLPTDSETSGFIFGDVALDTIEAPSGDAGPDANGLNNYGVVVGAFETPAGPSRGFLFTGPLGAFQLGEPPSGYTDLEANAVNDSGRVAGNAFTVNTSGAALTSVGVIGTMIDSVHTFTALPTLGGTLAQPTDNAITECGVVLGFATKPASATTRYAVAWVPTGCTIP